jgi:hypothetical protein
MSQSISETIEDLLFAAKGSPLGKPDAIVLTRKARRELTEEIVIAASGVRQSGNVVAHFRGIPVVAEDNAVGISLRYS